MYSASSYSYSAKLYIFSPILYVFSLILYVSSLNLYIFSQLISIQSHVIRIHFNVLCVTLWTSYRLKKKANENFVENENVSISSDGLVFGSTSKT